MKTVLVMLISFVAITTIVSGLMLVNNPGGEVLNLPLSLLQQTPFTDFLIPGILLALVVGGINLVALIANIQQKPNRYSWAIAGGVVLIGWIVCQVILIQTVNWLHFVYLGIGCLMVLTAFQLKGKWVV
jgi:hypothetical protein